MDELLFDDSCMRALLPSIERCAQSIRGWLSEGRLLVIRFNDDCDGAVCGMELFSAAAAFARENGIDTKGVGAFQLESAVYSQKDAFDDLSRARDAARKLALVIADLGANEESYEGVKALKDAGARVCIIDHHPPFAQTLALCDCAASSHEYDPTGSHTAGLVAYEVARRIFARAADEEWVHWSLQSDKSALAKKRDHAGAIALDYLSHFSEKQSTAQYYIEKISDERTIALCVKLAAGYEAKALQSGLKHSKITPVSDGALLVVCDISRAVKKGGYPPKGMCLNLVQDYLSNRHGGKAVVSLGFSGDSIGMRANAGAIRRGFDSNRVIRALKKEFGEAVHSGGGHTAAASVRFVESHARTILERASALVEGELKK